MRFSGRFAVFTGKRGGCRSGRSGCRAPGFRAAMPGLVAAILWGMLSGGVVLAQSGTPVFPTPGSPGGAIVSSDFSSGTTSLGTSAPAVPTGASAAPDYYANTLGDRSVTSSGTVGGYPTTGGYPDSATPSSTVTPTVPTPVMSDFGMPSGSAVTSGSGDTTAIGASGSSSPLQSFFSSWTSGGPTSVSTVGVVAGQTPKPAFRRYTITGRHENSYQVSSRINPVTGRLETVFTGGVNIVVEGFADERFTSVIHGDILDLSAENAVIWSESDFQTGAGTGLLSADSALEVYLSGDIECRMGDTCITADRMYMNVRDRIGAIMNAELVTPIPGRDVKVRIHSNLLRMTGDKSFSADESFITTSLIGLPRYRVQVGSAELLAHPAPQTDEYNRPVLNDQGQPVVDQNYEVRTRGNTVFMDQFPVFIAPALSANLNSNKYYLNDFRVGSDSVFGVQVDTGWDLYQILGLDTPPEGTAWDLKLDYLSKRGFGHGTGLRWDNRTVGNAGSYNGTMSGMVDYYGIYDTGKDDLSIYRSGMEPPQNYRYRLFGQHRQTLDAADWFGGDIQFQAEVGWNSDRWFIPQYFPDEWDTRKNETTELELKQMIDNRSMALRGEVRLNDFLTETQWYPKFDHYWLGQNLGDALTWSEHTSLGYGDIHVTTLPTASQNPDGAWRYLPWEVDSNGNPLRAQGGRFITRHELAWPIQLGGLKLTPYLLGEAGYWGEDMAGNDISRLFGQVGFRSSLAMTGVAPDVRSEFWNLNGLAHKASLDIHGFYAHSSKDLSEFPLYDRLDDDSIEAFRRRMFPYIFPGAMTIAPDPALPWKYDVRSYALRTGMQGWVTAPSMEIADDLFMFQVALNQRFQTKRGGIARQRIVDWFRFDTRLSVFPKKDRDNFGELVGLLDYDSRWQVGDRLAFTSTGMFDFFDQPLQFATFAAELDRSNGDAMYLGVHWLGNPGVPQTNLIASYDYRMTDCWRSALTMTMDLSKASNINQSFDIVRRGESFEILGGFSYNYATEVWGMHFGVNPVAMAKSISSRVQTTTLDTFGRAGAW